MSSAGLTDSTLVMFGIGLAFCALVVYIQTDWRSGVLLFLLWLLFDDLARKFRQKSQIVLRIDDKGLPRPARELLEI